MIKYYLYKIYHKALSYISVVFPGCRYHSGVLTYFNGHNKSESVLKNQTRDLTFLFAFWDSRLVHLGDQLFYLPMMIALKKEGFDVIVVGDSILKDLFQFIGVSVCSLADLEASVSDNSFVTVISKDDCFYRCKRELKVMSAFLGMNFSVLEGDARVSDLLMAQLTIFCEHVLAIKNWRPLFLDPSFSFSNLLRSFVEDVSSAAILDRFELNQPFVIFNNIIYSNFNDYSSQKKALSHYLDTHFSQFKVVYVGSLADRCYSLPTMRDVDLDLRGELSFKELIVLFFADSLKGVLTFDTFISHIGLLCGSKMYVVPKTKSTAALIKSRFLPMLNLDRESLIWIE